MTDWLTARCNMVESQIKPNAVTDQRLISALLAVPRELFVPTSMHALTYCDLDIDISVDASEDACHILAPMTFQVQSCQL
jgi:protein-L-isoaspartate(D-aspartate) O-methyltransferase